MIGINAEIVRFDCDSVYQTNFGRYHVVEANLLVIIVCGALLASAVHGCCFWTNVIGFCLKIEFKGDLEVHCQ